MEPPKLSPGGGVRVAATSQSLLDLPPQEHRQAAAFWQAEGFRLSFAPSCWEAGLFHTPAAGARVRGLHEAFCDPDVSLIIAARGGFCANELLPRLDYGLIARCPKPFCGYSDNTALLNAIYAKTGLVTYHGPHYSTFVHPQEPEYTRRAFFDCAAGQGALAMRPSRTAGRWRVLQEGACTGVALGGNLCTLNLLQGTPYWPNMQGAVLFLEDDNIMGEYFCREFDRNLESLLQAAGSGAVRGLVFGRFEESCGLTEELLCAILKDKLPPSLPVICGADFGHVLPIMTFPVGGRVRLRAEGEEAAIVFESR